MFGRDAPGAKTVPKMTGYVQKKLQLLFPQQKLTPRAARDIALVVGWPATTLRLPSPRDVVGKSGLARPLNAATRRSSPSRRAGFEELGIDWGPAYPFGPDDDPGTPMTHQDSSESDELRPDLFAPGAAPLPAPEPVVTPAANAQPERPVAPFVRTLRVIGRSLRRDALRVAVWKINQCRRRVDGVEDNVMIQHERAVKF